MQPNTEKQREPAPGCTHSEMKVIVNLIIIAVNQSLKP